uniref:Centrosomal protein of 290kDa coiled-coil region domain-containing protein n=2 Tax=Clastoptera arizonana TaxID=38151 RepID=A0A1B6CNZ0_9HEMI
MKQLTIITNKQDAMKNNLQHAEKMNSLIKDQLKTSEERCKQLEKDIAAMVQHNLSSQLIEAELRDQLVESFPYSEVIQIKNKLANTEKLVIELKADKLKLQENIESAEKQILAWEHIRHYHDFQHDALQRQVLELSAASEDKATISRLSRELMRVQESEMCLSNELSKIKEKQIQMDLCKENYEAHIQNLEGQFNLATQQYMAKTRNLIYIIQELHQRYLGSLPLSTAECLSKLLLHSQFENQHTQEMINRNFNTEKILNLIKSKLNLNGNQNLKKIEGLKLHMRLEVLESQLEQKQGQLERHEDLVASLQQEFVTQDQIWEKKQLLWEQLMLDLFKREVANEVSKSKDPQNDDTDMSNNVAELQVVQVKETVESIPLIVMEAIANVDDTKRTDSPQINIPEELPKKHVNLVTENINRELKNNDAPSKMSVIIDDSKEIADLKEQLNQAKTAMNDQLVKFTDSEKEITEMKKALSVLNEQLIDKEQKLSMKEKEYIELKNSLPEKLQEKVQSETTEILALKATVTSLQNIVNQKEETIGRYQALLKECREEHSNTVLSLQQELANLQESLDNKEQTLIKMKNEEAPEKGPAIKLILEKYLTRFHHLEDELAQLKDQNAQLNSELNGSREQTEKWAHTAEERLKSLQEMKQKLDKKSDCDETNIEMEEKLNEIDRLSQIISQLRTRLETKENLSGSRERLRSELERCKKRLELTETQLSDSKIEIQRLHQQLTIRTRNTPKPESISSAREETLQKRIRLLEEQINELQEKEEKERTFRKNRCNEEFEKWELRKRWQSSNDKLRSQLQEKSSQVEALRASTDRLKDTIIRLERERNSLESRLKSAKGTVVTQSLVDELEKDRVRLKEELKAVKKSSELVTNSSSLSHVVEAQERRIAALRLSLKGDSALADEIERLQECKIRLQKSNLRLEAENLELKLKLEKDRSPDFSPQSSVDLVPEQDVCGKELSFKNLKKKRREDLEKAVLVLKQVVEKLQAENKRLHNMKVDSIHNKGYVENLQIELQRCQENYLDSVERIANLEQDLKEAKSKLTYQQEDVSSDCELVSVKAQLAQKCQLLSKIKVMLEMAVVREKALKEQVLDLQKLVPPEMLKGTYHIHDR